jgi:hypothetical protein
MYNLERSAILAAAPIPASQGPSGYVAQSHGVALLGIVVPATAFVARLMRIQLLLGSVNTCFAPTLLREKA